MAEDAPLAPCSRLGEARRHKEERIGAAGIRWTMIGLPEFYGPHVQTLTGRPLQAIAQGQRGRWWGPADATIEPSTCPTPPRRRWPWGSLTAAMASCLTCRAVHTTARGFLSAAIRVAGMGISSVMPTALVRAAALVHPLARAFVDILHLWQQPILLDGSKLRARFPEPP